MAYEFMLPDIGEGIAEAEVVRWRVAVGDNVTEDQPLAEVETDKAVVEMPAPASGTVLRLGAEAGEIVRVGQLLVVIEDGSGDGVGARADAPARRPMATPATRRLARELGVDLGGIDGTGPGGRITDHDVRAEARPARVEQPETARVDESAPVGFAGVGQSTPAPTGTRPDERVPVRGVRRKTAAAMTQAWREIPHSVGFHEVDAGELLALRKRLTARAEALGVSLTLTPFLVKATALALVEHPMVNASFDAEAEEIILRGRRNIGIAVDTPDGLVIPVVKDADSKPLLALAREVSALASAARDRRVSLADLQDGTFTITNHGPLGGNFASSIIRPPEAGILGFGRVKEQAVVRDSEIVARPILPLSFAADHRLIDGDLSLGFCHTVRSLIEDPVLLLLEER